MENKDPPLSLKVMRQTRPSLYTGISVQCDMRDLPRDIFQNEVSEDISRPQPDCGVGQVLLLPQSFGNIYLGETFSCCICVHNTSLDSFQVGLKCTLQMSNQSVPVLSNVDDLVVLEHDQLFSRIVHHEVKEIGTHILVCSVNYRSVKNPQVAEQSVRKFFKFQVMKPFDVKTKFYNAESEDVYLEAGIQNVTSGAIVLEKVNLEPSPFYSVTPLNDLIKNVQSGTHDKKPEQCRTKSGLVIEPDIKSGSKSELFIDKKSESVFGPISTLNPSDVRQYLFWLKPKTSEQLNEEQSKISKTAKSSSADVGKLDIVWRSSMGDKGRLQTSQLQRMALASEKNDIKVVVSKIPKIVRIDEAFSLTVNITNKSDRELRLHLDFLRGDFVTEWHCTKSRSLEPLEPNQTISVDLKLKPFQLGLQTIAGLRITDTFLKRTYDYENLAQVFVTSEISREKDAVFARLSEELLKASMV